MRMGWVQIFKRAKRFKILRKIGEIVRKKPNAVHKPEQTMKTMFKGFLQNIRIYHLQLQTAKAHISTYYQGSWKMQQSFLPGCKAGHERFVCEDQETEADEGDD